MARSLSPTGGVVAPAITPAAPATALRIYGALAFGIVCIALSAIFTTLSGIHEGTVTAFYRVAISLAALSPLFARDVRRGHVTSDRRVWIIALAVGIFFALDLALWNTSLFLIPAGTSTLLGNDAPIIVGLVALVVFRERLGRLYWIGLAVALAGMGIIVGGDALAGANVLGDVLALTAGCSYALYLIGTARVRARLSTLPSLWIPGLSGAVLLLAYNVVTHGALWGFSANAWLYLFLVALVSQAAGWLAINYALGHLPASIVSPTLLGQPVLTALFAVPLLAQPLDPRQIVGGIVALAGIYVVNRASARH
jgi:drug/metabolite transporter (DMT)-like permease